MSKEERTTKIQQLEEALSSRVICFLTSDRTNLEPPASVITRDCVKVIEKHLKISSRLKSLSLYLVSHGGDIDVPWALVNLLRSHCEELKIVVPYVCYSAATLIALGCDKIVAGPRAQFSPTDPTLQVRTSADERAPIMQFGVEDIKAFVEFAKTTLGKQFTTRGHEALAKLIDRVQPEILGSVNRTYSRSRLLIRKMLGLTAKKYAKRDLEQITDLLTVGYFAHAHPISRQEMISDLKLPVVNAEDLNVDSLIWELYEEYATEFKSREPFDIQREARACSQNPIQVQVKSKFVEDSTLSDFYVQTYVIQSTSPLNLNFSLPQIPGIASQLVEQIAQNLVAQLNAQLQGLATARKVASFGEWRVEQ